MKRRAASILALTLALSGGLPLSSALAQARWDLATAYPTTNFHTENLAQFTREVEAATGGRLRITVHANASLFKANEIKRAVQGGQAPAGEILLPHFENENPVFGVDGIPFLATSYADSRRLYDAQRPVLEKLLGAQGLRLLYAVAWPPQGIFSRKEINSAADLRGTPWRAYSPATARLAELIGAQPVTIQAAELAQAMASGAVDSMMSSGSTGYDSRIYESIRYYYDTQAFLPKNAIIVSRKAFDALDRPAQDALLKAAADAEARGWQLSAEKDDWYKKALADKGMKILLPPARLTADLRQMGDTMLADWLKKAGPDGEAIIAAYRKSAPSPAR
ncbi:TRAP transporter substrate-binding protein [Acidovorax sp. NCPPB 2350]|nr:TRAP transporter substrate-binding protein [Acidovorax sp. NCPPB 2350]